MGILLPIAILSSSVAAFFAARAYWVGPRCRGDHGRCRAAVVGDSITAGDGYITFLRRNLPNYSFTNFGNVGYGTAAIAEVLRNQVLPNNYDEIIIQGGLNDLSHTDEYILENLHQMVQLAKSSGARVVLLSLTPWSRAPERIRELNHQLRWRSMLWGVHRFVDIYSPLVDSQGGLRASLIGDAAMNVHPNAAGHTLIGQALLDSAY
jgi:lysophospholipase L1-like esterase